MLIQSTIFCFINTYHLLVTWWYPKTDNAGSTCFQIKIKTFFPVFKCLTIAFFVLKKKSFTFSCNSSLYIISRSETVFSDDHINLFCPHYDFCVLFNYNQLPKDRTAA